MSKFIEKFPVWEDFKKPVVLFGFFWYIFLTLVLTIFIGNFWAAVCFSLAAYSVIWNDAVQTLMTYLHSNSDIPWKILYTWVSVVLLWVIWYWFLTNGWDITYGRLEAKWYADITVEWYFIFFPMILVFLTRFRGIPVSTSLLLLSIFASELLFQKIVVKSMVGYLLAFGVAFLTWIIAEKILAKRAENKKSEKVSDKKTIFWRAAQTITTILLFSTWLMHDMVNIAVFLPKQLSFNVMLLISAIFLIGLAYTFYIKWGPVGNIVTKKTSTDQIVAATMIDLIYFLILLIFKEWSNIPMSTTWVFLWLLSWRQLAIRTINRIWVVAHNQRFKVAFKEIWKDFSKLMVGLGISVLALIIMRYLTGS